jgi:hypothetical protein
MKIPMSVQHTLVLKIFKTFTPTYEVGVKISFTDLPIGLRLVLTHAVKGVAFTRFRWFYGLAF